MALTVGTDTYISVADATTYLATQLGALSWADASAADREKALRMACERLERMHYQGERTADDQALAWPRTDVPGWDGADLESAAVPQFVRDAQCWEADYLLAWAVRGAGRSEAEELQAQGVKSVKMGDLSYAFEAAADPLARALGPRARAILEPYIAWAPKGITL